MKKISIFILCLFILIILAQSKSPNKLKSKQKNVHKPNKQPQQNQFLINFIFAFCVLPIMLLYFIQGQELHDDFQMEILLAIFCWIAILAGYYLLTNQWGSIEQKIKKRYLKTKYQKQKAQSKNNFTKVPQVSLNVMKNSIKNNSSQSRWQVQLYNDNIPDKFQLKIYFLIDDDHNRKNSQKFSIRADSRNYKFRGSLFKFPLQKIQLISEEGLKLQATLNKKFKQRRFQGQWQYKQSSGILKMVQKLGF